MASEIAYKKPHLVAVQEAALWRTGPSPETATQLLSDNAGTLVSGTQGPRRSLRSRRREPAFRLRRAGGHAGRAPLHRPECAPRPGRPQASAVLLLERPVRIRSPPISRSPALNIPAGWISADVHIGNKQFRVVTTHLQSPILGVPEATDVQVAQAQELIHELRNLQVPVVICGDFNSDANHGGYIDNDADRRSHRGGRLRGRLAQGVMEAPRPDVAVLPRGPVSRRRRSSPTAPHRAHRPVLLEGHEPPQRGTRRPPLGGDPIPPTPPTTPA